MQSAILKGSRVRISMIICAVVLVAASLLVSAPAESALKTPCCLDEWQGGGLCPSGGRVASYCSSPGCESCGTMFCYSGLCFQ
jgi:hypothetical protein